MQLYLHSPIRVHGMAINLSTGLELIAVRDHVDVEEWKYIHVSD